MKTTVGIAVTFGFIILAMEFQGGHSPFLITSCTKPGCKIKGNICINTGRRFYHVPGAEDYDSTVIYPTNGEKWFCTES
jgi:hypothetical protein